MKNNQGMVLIPLLLVIAVIIPMYYMASIKNYGRMTEARSEARTKIQAQTLFHQIAVIVRESYNRAEAGGCTASILTGTSPGGGAYQIRLCLPSQCLTNPVTPGNPICLGSNNAQLALHVPNEESKDLFVLDKAEKDLKWPLWDFFFLPEARAQNNPYFPPTVPAVADAGLVTRPSAAPTRICDGTDLKCLTIRICIHTANCVNSQAYFQRVGFRP